MGVIVLLCGDMLQKHVGHRTSIGVIVSFYHECILVVKSECACVGHIEGSSSCNELY